MNELKYLKCNNCHIDLSHAKGGIDLFISHLKGPKDEHYIFCDRDCLQKFLEREEHVGKMERNKLG